MPVITDPKSDEAGVSTRKLLLACLPAVAIGATAGAPVEAGLPGSGTP